MPTRWPTCQLDVMGEWSVMGGTDRPRATGCVRPGTAHRDAPRTIGGMSEEARNPIIWTTLLVIACTVRLHFGWERLLVQERIGSPHQDIVRDIQITPGRTLLAGEGRLC